MRILTMKAKGNPYNMYIIFFPFASSYFCNGCIFPKVLRLQLLKSGYINDRPSRVGLECMPVVHHGPVLLAHRLFGSELNNMDFKK